MALQDDLIACGAVRFGQFTLTSGKTSPYYVDVKQATSRPDLLRAIAKDLAPRVAEADVLAGVELGAVPILVALALETGKPFAIIRKHDRPHGTGQGIEGAKVKDKTVLVVEDVTTTGGSVADAVARLRQQGAIVTRVETVVDRDEGGRQRLEALGVELGALVTANDLLARVEAETQ